MPPTPQATLFATQADVEGLLSALGVQSRLDDDSSGAVEVEESGYMQQCLEYATQRVKFYCSVHYATDKLATSWLVNDWATTIAAWWLSARRGNPVPDSLLALYQGDDGKSGVIGDLIAVRKKLMIIPEIAFRHVDWPAWSNIRVDPRYRIRQIRVQRTMSEQTPPETPRRNVDLQSEYVYEW